MHLERANITVLLPLIANLTGIYPRVLRTVMSCNRLRVRRGQDAGVAEIYHSYPDLKANEAKERPSSVGLARLALTFPLGFAIYALVALLVRLQPSGMAWSRGR